MIPVEKLCPVILRAVDIGPQVLVFAHPLAGMQLVKGTREAGESVFDGVLRELAEESGLVDATVSANLGSSSAIVEDQVWHFVKVEALGLGDQWTFETTDDGGQRFDFSWWPLIREPGPEWHESFVKALRYIRAAV